MPPDSYMNHPLPATPDDACRFCGTPPEDFHRPDGREDECPACGAGLPVGRVPDPYCGPPEPDLVLGTAALRRKCPGR
jgi:hypothetical protein